MGKAIKLFGSLVRLRPTVGSDRAALMTIRSTEEVRRRWPGNDLKADFDHDLAYDDDVPVTDPLSDNRR